MRIAKSKQIIRLFSKLRLLLILFVRTARRGSCINKLCAAKLLVAPRLSLKYWFQKKSIVLIVCLFFNVFQTASAQDSSGVSDDVTPLSQAEIDQFQAWLKNSKQHHSDPVKVKKKQQTVYTSEVPALITKEGPYEEMPAVISPPISYNKSQQLMLQSAPKSSTPPSQDSIDAFNAMMQQNVPLTPQQVVKLRQLIDQSQRAAAIPATVPPKPVSSTLIINLAPGTTPPAIRLAQGYVTSLVFVDSTGSPWPVSSYDLGNPKAATIQWDQKSNIILIQAISPYGDSDLIIRLVGLPTPITLELVSGQRVVDYRTDIHVPGIGPNTKDLPIGTALPGSANQLLLNVLDGIAPPGSRPLTVLGGDALAWLLGDRMYVRSRLTVLSPGWTGRMVSPDGMMAYEIPRSSTVLVSQYGQPIELKVEGF